MKAQIVHLTQLAVLTSLVDGEASPEELETIAKAVSEKHEATREEIKALAERMVARYTAEGLARKPVQLVRRGQQSLRILSGPLRRDALRIARQVASATGGTDEGEATFLEELARSVHATH